jgi:hypothetical protein
MPIQFEFVVPNALVNTVDAVMLVALIEAPPDVADNSKVLAVAFRIK